MSPYVFRMIFLRKESFFAIVTLVLFDLQMHSFSMVNQRRISLKGRPTFRAKEALDVFVDGDFVDT